MTSISKKTNIVKEKSSKSEPDFDCEYLDWWSKYYASFKEEENCIATDELNMAQEKQIKEMADAPKKHRRVSITSIKNLTKRAKMRKLSLMEEKTVKNYKFFFNSKFFMKE